MAGSRQRLSGYGCVRRGLAVVLGAALWGPVVAAPKASPAAAVAAKPKTDYRGAARVAVLYDAPSLKARKRFIAPRGMPLEILTTVGAWVKVRDMAGTVLWVERADLGPRQSVVAATGLAVRQQPQDAAPVVVQTGRGVLLDLVDPPAVAGDGAWLRVRHRDTGAGWVRVTEVWGW